MSHWLFGKFVSNREYVTKWLVITNNFFFELWSNEAMARWNNVLQRMSYKAMRKQLYPSNKSLKLDILKFTAILSIQELTWSVKNTNIVALRIAICLKAHSKFYDNFHNSKPFKDNKKCFLFNLKSCFLSQYI